MEAGVLINSELKHREIKSDQVNTANREARRLRVR